MNAKEVLKVIRDPIEQEKKKNQNFVSIDALLTYLGAIESHIEKTEEGDKRKFEADLATFRAEHERNLAHYEAQQTYSVEMFKSVFTYGHFALQSVILINGGAAAALLAFIGNIWSKGIAQTAVGPITNSIAYFAFGVLAGTVGAAGSYFAQYFYSAKFYKVGVAFHVITISLVVIAYVLFGLGVWDAYSAFFKHLTPTPYTYPDL